MRDAAVLDRLHAIAKFHKEHSHPLELSDDGLMADLADREEDAAGKLALTDRGGKKEKKNCRG